MEPRKDEESTSRVLGSEVTWEALLEAEKELAIEPGVLEQSRRQQVLSLQINTERWCEENGFYCW